MESFKQHIDALNESAASDRYEKSCADYLKTFGLNATRPKVDNTYSDLVVKGVVKEDIWIEVKMNHTDQLGNTRAFWDGKKWDAALDKKGPSKGKLSPLKVYICKTLDKEGKPFVKAVRKHVGRQDIIIPTTIGMLRDSKSVTRDEMIDFLKGQKNQYLISLPNKDLGALVTEHYTKGKTEPTYYIQAGDDFYRIGTKDPLKLGNKVPLFSGTGPFRMRVGMRTNYYEVQPEVKITGGMPKSDYSIKPGTKKKNPFEDYIK